MIISADNTAVGGDGGITSYKVVFKMPGNQTNCLVLPTFDLSNVTIRLSYGTVKVYKAKAVDITDISNYTDATFIQTCSSGTDYNMDFTGYNVLMINTSGIGEGHGYALLS